MKKLLPALLAMMCNVSNAQISITYQDFQAAFLQDAVFVTCSTPNDGTGYEVFVGEASSVAQTWDITALPMDYMALSKVIEPSSAPFSGDFPNSNFVLYEKYWFGEGDTLHTWNYKELQNDRLLLYGESDEYEVFWTWDPPAVQSAIPLQVGTTWISERDSTYYMPEVYVISQNESVVDAFGNLKIPGGEYPCIRVKQDNLSISHTPVGVDTSVIRSFNLYTKGMIEVHLGTILEDQFGLTTIWSNGVKVSGRQGTVGVKPVLPSPNTLISDVYPNPAADRVEISFNLSRNTCLKVQVLDLSGREILNHDTGILTAGTQKHALDVSQIPAGVYSLKLEASGRSDSRKLVICR
ncbi:MAG: T9SS type A sorting domain-containing protein [Bacteroidales bacterium]|nr:T9SS type A sorting domain-containing protein [Bacteroidales bacterium]